MKKWLFCLLAGCLLTQVWANEITDTPSDNSELSTTTETDNAPTPPIERPALQRWSSLQLQRLQQAYPDEFRAIVADDLDAGALYRPANRTPARGWIILLPGYGQPADSTDTLDLLRRQLPDAGWHSLSLQLPEPEFIALRLSTPSVAPAPAADSDTTHDAESSDDTSNADDELTADNDTAAADNTDTDTDTDNKPAETTLPQSDNKLLAPVATDMPPPADYPTSMQSLLDAAIQMAREQSAPLVLLGQREGAYWLLHTACNMPTPPDALILLHPSQPTSGLPADAATLAALAGSCKLPITDYYAPAAAGSAKQRLDASKRNPDSRYLQVLLKEPVIALQHNEALRRIKGRLILFDSEQ